MKKLGKIGKLTKEVFKESLKTFNSNAIEHIINKSRMESDIKDENGVIIKTGDILLLENDFMYMYGVVYFKQGQFVVETYRNVTYINDLSGMCNLLVIGNIDNPVL